MRNAMPPPLPTPAPPGGGSSMPTCVFARRQGHIALSSGTGSTHTAHAQARRERTHRRTRKRAIHQISASTSSDHMHMHTHWRAVHGHRHGHRRTVRMQRVGGGGSGGGRLMPASLAMHTYAIIMQSFWRFSMQLRCVSSKTKVLFIILIFYRHSVFNALRPVCCEMDAVLLK